MKKRFILAGLLLGLSIIFVSMFAVADDPIYETNATHYNIVTSNGTVNISIGALVGGDPVNFIILVEDTVLDTTEGEKTVPNGTKIDCDPPSTYPNNCDPF